MNKQQLASRIWASANKLRNKIDANEYKDYILGLIFYKFLCDREISTLREDFGLADEDLRNLVEDFSDPDMATLIGECQKRIGYFIEYKNLFTTWLADPLSFSVATLSDALRSFERNTVVKYKSVYDGIFTTLSNGLAKLGDNPSAQTKALREIISLIKDIPTNGSEDYDVLGYVYEYLISNFAASAGKKAGEFYTPHEVAMVMSEIVAHHHRDRDHIDIYDPTSGSGSLLITIGKAVSKHIMGKNSVRYFAQELMENTYNLTRMNLVMRGVIADNIRTRCADTLEEDWPMREEGVDIDQPLCVDAVVSNPPYSQHWNVRDKELDPRFVEYGLAPKTKADYAFLLHELHHLHPRGIMAIVLPHGVLFRGRARRLYDADGSLLDESLREEGQGEGRIRSQLIEKNNIDAIIGLPAGIFFGTGIPTIIMVLRKNRGDEGVLIIDASRGFVKEGTQNRLRACDIKRITDTYISRRSVPGYSREVTRDEIRRNDYNLNIPRYVDSSDRAEPCDIYATMFGGIPEAEIDALSRYWEVFPSLRGELFAAAPPRHSATMRAGDIAAVIAANADVGEYRRRFDEAFGSLRDMLRQRLIAHVADVDEVRDADIISADIIGRAADVPLLDPYAAYQILADRWPVLVGDIEIIQTEGFGACNVIEANYRVVKKNDEEREVPDGEKGRIMPFGLVQRELLGENLDALNIERDRLDAVQTELGEILESLTPDEQESMLNDDNTRWDTKRIAAAFNTLCDELAIRGNKAAKMERFLAADFEPESYEWKLRRVMSLQETEKTLKKSVATLEAGLLADTKATIEALDMKQIVHLLTQKWIEPIASAIDSMCDEVISGLEAEVRRLADKYAETLVDIDRKISDAEGALASLIDNLTGPAGDMDGLREFQKLLRHE